MSVQNHSVPPRPASSRRLSLSAATAPPRLLLPLHRAAYYEPTPSTPSEKTYAPDTLILLPSDVSAPPSYPYTVLSMIFHSRRWIASALLSFVLLGWLWHVAIVNRVAPDSWSSGEYADADKVLKGWRATVCREAGFCGNFYGSAGSGTKAVHGVSGESKETPEFVLDYAPYVYLHSKELFLPCDINEHLVHTTAYLNYTPIAPSVDPLLSNLDFLNKFGDHVYLTSDDDPEAAPSWLRGDKNMPVEEGDEDEIGRSSAPSIILWIEKDGGRVVDAFYFYFYSFNLGLTVANFRFGNHIGDWEHNAIRFVDGKPTTMFFSEHSGGAAFEYQAVEKIGQRPISYSAIGSHANYATPGAHYYAMPFHLLADHTDKGRLWDVQKNAFVYHYDLASNKLTPGNVSPNAPTAWFYYLGRWGDRFYPLSDKRQYRVAGQYHYVNGPTGPIDKNLDRNEICQNENVCVVQPSLHYKLEGVHGGKWDDEDEWAPGSKNKDVPVVEFSGEADPNFDGDSDGDFDEFYEPPRNTGDEKGL